MLVAPLAGAWIEIQQMLESEREVAVAPLAGAWIEIWYHKYKNTSQLSLPSRERGLKYCVDYIMGRNHSRSPRGSVD